MLNHLEIKVGADSFGNFIKAYIQKFKYGTITSSIFKHFFCEYFSASQLGESLAEVLSDEFWERALQCTGMPLGLFPDDFENSLSLAAERVAAAWTADTNPTEYIDVNSWSSPQKCILLERLIQRCTVTLLSTETLCAVDAQYRFTETRNAEIKFRWLSLCLQCGSSFIVPHVVAFLTQQGRMKYVRPLYRMLQRMDARVAMETYTANSIAYHPIARKLIESDLKL